MPFPGLSLAAPRVLLATLLSAAAAGALGAQPTVLTIASPEEEARRLAQLRGHPTAGTLLRDGATLLRAPDDTISPPTPPGASWRTWLRTTGQPQWLRPQLRVVHNSALATSLNEGALWTGRGTSALVRSGVAFRQGRVDVTLMPELVVSENRPVEVRAGQTPGWSAWSSPWRTSEMPADLPLRFGNAPVRAVSPGQSRVEVALGALAVGISSANLWWGPGVRNALVLGNHADGMPHALVRTRRPVTTPVGAFEARWMAGRLTESLYFDQDPANDHRAMGGMAVSWVPTWIPGATLGLTRLVVRRVDGGGLASTAVGGAAAAIRAVLPVGGPSRTDQMQGAFLRWVFPEDGFEFWGEYATTRLPSLRQWLVAPNADAGWTLGAQWLLPRPRPTDGTWRLQLEITEVAQSRALAGRAPRDWGTGTAVAQGFTHRGRMLGVSTGPGSSHWWGAMDRWHPRWSAGGYVARTRWENDALYRQPTPNQFAHDVSVSGGVRASATAAGWWQQMVLGVERRFNYQFESGYLAPLGRGQRTVTNLRLELTLAPTAPRAPHP